MFFFVLCFSKSIKNKFDKLNEIFISAGLEHLVKTSKKKVNEDICIICKKNLGSPCSLQSHIRHQHHTNEEYYCDECPGSTFSKKKNFNAHLKQFHNRSINNTDLTKIRLRIERETSK